MTEMPEPLSVPVRTDPGTQAATRLMSSLVRIRAGGEHTAGAFALLDHQAERGYAAPQHVHEHEDETFFVLDGSVRFLVGDDDYTAGPGVVAVLPRGIPHSLVVTSPTARLLNLVTPAGFERFVLEAGTPLEAPAGAPPGIETLTALGARFGIEIIGPPPAP
ncbi:cupin domain-containing protein [Streptomyces winkii]|uniref:cupin domain-containing protein n=1 Tax=Streptomyces winkii TaxID=3051178 RepID=UPI0028D3FBB9|nr:cupin domain-containing protein [Streptomyces sp. DSM 40971]